jgi:hypothetical protein
LEVPYTAEDIWLDRQQNLGATGSTIGMGD